jgi:Flp pilus assembly protein CpaB
MARRNTGGRLRALLFLFISFGAAAIASVVIYFVISSYQRELLTVTKPDQVVEVIVAKHDIWQGKTISAEDDLAKVELPLDYVPDSVLRTAEQASGRVPRERILAHEFIREERLADPEAGIGLNAIIPRGMRALSINISDGSAVSGFLNPGNYVDTLVTIEGDDAREAETRTLLQAVTVLAVNNRLGNTAESLERARPSVTLAVTPDLAEKLTHAVAQGEVTLTLRNDIDVTHVETHGALVSNLLGGASDEKRITVQEWTARTRASVDGTVTIIQGKDVSTEKIRGGQ